MSFVYPIPFSVPSDSQSTIFPSRTCMSRFRLFGKPLFRCLIHSGWAPPVKNPLENLSQKTSNNWNNLQFPSPKCLLISAVALCQRFSREGHPPCSNHVL